MKGLEPCVKCGRRYPVERKPGVLGYVHLSEVAEESAQQRIAEIHALELKKLDLYSTKIRSNGADHIRLGQLPLRAFKDSTLRERLHPAVFDTNFRIEAPDHEARP